MCQADAAAPEPEDHVDGGALRRLPLRLSRIVACVMVISALAACGSPDDQAVETTVQEFEDALARGDGAAACALLTQSAADEVAYTEGKPCADALPDLGLPDRGSSIRVEQYGVTARASTSTDTLFLAFESGGWQVSALGCRGGSQHAPYQCLVQG
jgi:hypothetical protein